MAKRTISIKGLERYRKHLIMEEKSEATIKKYVGDAKAFLTYCKEKKFNKEMVISYKEKLIMEGYAIRSINSKIASLNSLFKYMGRYELTVKSLKMQREIYSTEEKEIRRNEYRKLCETAKAESSYRLYMILQTICATGIRISELKFITVEAAKKGEAEVHLKGKYRKVIIIQSLQEKLIWYANKRRIASGPIFVTRRGKPVDRTNVWKDMKALCLKAGVPPQKVFPHNLRHLFARLFYGAEKDIAKLADILGHSSIDTTRIYIMSTGTEHRAKMEKMMALMK